MKRRVSAGYYLGMDGGGTHTLAVAVDGAGRVMARARGGSLNFFGADLERARAELGRVMRGLGRRLPRGAELRRGVVGCAALFEEATPAEARALCGGILPLGLVRVVSDCEAAWFGATVGRPGVVVVAGTGSIVLAGSGRGRMTRTGGWGHVLGDEGSGYWIAREAIRAAIAAEEGRGPATRLGGWVREYFRVRRLTDLVPVIHSQAFTKERLAGLSGYLASVRAIEDGVFRATCRRAGVELAAQVVAAARRARLGRRGWVVYPVGGVLEGNAAVRGAFRRALRSEDARVVFGEARLTPVMGAAAMALKASGIRLTREIIANLSRPGT